MFCFSLFYCDIHNAWNYKTNCRQVQFCENKCTVLCLVLMLHQILYILECTTNYQLCFKNKSHQWSFSPIYLFLLHVSIPIHNSMHQLQQQKHCHKWSRDRERVHIVIQVLVSTPIDKMLSAFVCLTLIWLWYTFMCPE